MTMSMTHLDNRVRSALPPQEHGAPRGAGTSNGAPAISKANNVPRRLIDRLDTLPVDDLSGALGQPLPSPERLRQWQRLIDRYFQDLRVLLSDAENMPLESLSRSLHTLRLPPLDALTRADGFELRARRHIGTLRAKGLQSLHAIRAPAGKYLDWAANSPGRAALYERSRCFGWLVPRSIRRAEDQMRRGRQVATGYQRAADTLIADLDTDRQALRTLIARLILPCAQLIRRIEQIRARHQAEITASTRPHAETRADRVTFFDPARRTRNKKSHDDDCPAMSRARQTVDRLRTACRLQGAAQLPHISRALSDLLTFEDIIFDDVLIVALASNQAQCATYDAMLEPYVDIIDSCGRSLSDPPRCSAK